MNEMLTEYVACPNCAADSPVKWAEESGYFLMKCGQCGLLYVNPRPAPVSISEANKTGVHRTADGRLVVTTHRRPAKVKHYSKIIGDLFQERISSGLPVRWLDIGAGYGELVEAVALTFPSASHVAGIEPMKVKVDAARSLGLAVTDTPLSEVEGSYDVISLINVFSHLPDFKSFLLQIRDKLTENGMLFIETGNAGDLVKRADYPDLLYLPDHLVFAGKAQMKSMLESSGFTLDRVVMARVDDPIWAAKVSVKSFLAGHPFLRIPYTSPFRTSFYKARLASRP